MTFERKYLPTIGDLIDRLSISMMKSVKIDRNSYRMEMRLILDDLYNLLGSERDEYDWVGAIYPMLVVTYINAVIWENEAAIRAGTDHDLVTQGELEHQRLRLTHSLNGVRSRAKNEINKIFGGRVDNKIDCLAADLPPEFGDWRLFDDEG